VLLVLLLLLLLLLLVSLNNDKNCWIFRHDPGNSIAKTQFLVWLMLQPGWGGAPTLHNDLGRDSREIPASLLARSARACQNPPIACMHVMYVCMYWSAHPSCKFKTVKIKTFATQITEESCHQIKKNVESLRVANHQTSVPRFYFWPCLPRQEGYCKMIFWLVLKLEISSRIMISWRILVSFRGLFWRLYFCMVKYFSFRNPSFALPSFLI
jgi:hypothetical protein